MIYASCFAYILRHVVGADAWEGVLERELRNLSLSTVAGFRTIGSVAMPGIKCRVSVHAGSSIARSRSMAAGQFLSYDECDVWLSCDEDVLGDGTTTARLIAAARATRGVVSAPCWLRLSKDKPPKLNFTMLSDPHVTPCTDVGLLVSGDSLRTGFGLVAMHRSAIERMAKDVPWPEDEQGRYPALFAEMVGERWIGEDFAFSVRAHKADVPISLLANVTTDHAGVRCTVRVDDKGTVEANYDGAP
jgi:hypothetical protein